MRQLIDAINSFQKLDYETEHAVIKYFVIEKYKKDAFIIEEGKICKKIYFIKEGAVRADFIGVSSFF